jgi:hypothetical protein
MLVSKARAYPNISLGWKGLPGTNTVAYCESVIFFKTLATGVNVLTLFTAVNYRFSK